jgi:hypothetical protein
MDIERLRHIAQDIGSELRAIELDAKRLTAVTGLVCKTGCGACCQSPGNIWATVGEMLPMAFDIFDQGRLDSTLETLENSSDDGICHMHAPDPLIRGNGRCMAYTKRPITCILFGAAKLIDKNGNAQFIGCAQLLNQLKPDAMKNTKDIPSARASTQKVLSMILDPNLREELPLNKALTKSLELIRWSTQYGFAKTGSI